MRVPENFKVMPTNDLAFKLLMSEGEIGGKDRLISIIESALKIKITDLQYIDRILDAKDYSNGEARVDVRALVNTNILTNVEMQIVGNVSDIGARSIYYVSKQMAGQSKEDKSYAAMNQCKTIFIVKDGLSVAEEGYVHSAMMRFENNKEMSDKLEVVLIDLKKFGKMNRKYEEMDMLDKWSYFLLHSKEEDEIMVRLIQDNKLLRGAEDTMKKFDQDERIRDMIYQREKDEMDRFSLKVTSFEEGKAEGKAEGISEGIASEKKKTVINMLNAKLDIEIIQQVTGLSREEIEALNN